MKKITLCMAFTAMAMLTAAAQDGERIFKRFKGDVSLGYAAPLSSGNNKGFLFALEPKFALTDQLSVGFRTEGAVMGRFSSTNQYGGVTIENGKGVASYIATADYYFSNNYSFRPFVGAGVGVVGLIADYNNFSDEASVTKMGGIIRAGGEVKHLRFGVEYNIIPEADVDTYDNSGNIVKTKTKFGYIGIKLGVCFGGGPR